MFEILLLNPTGILFVVIGAMKNTSSVKTVLCFQENYQLFVIKTDIVQCSKK